MTNLDTSNMTSAELSNLAAGLANQARERAAAERKAEREERRAKAAAEAKGHYDRMFTEIGQPLADLNEAQHGAVYSVAWEFGHSSGFAEVEGYYGDFAELARKIIDLA